MKYSHTKKIIEVLLSYLAIVSFLISYYIGAGAIRNVLSSIAFTLSFLWLVVAFAEKYEAAKSRLSRILKEPYQSDKLYNEPRIAVRLLETLLPSDESQQNVIGDVLEEFAEFKSKTTAYIWLYKQVLKSVLPLVYKNLKSRLASYFGERIR